MSVHRLSLDDGVLEQIRFLQELNSEVWTQVVALGIPLLEGRDISEDVKQISVSTTISGGKLSKFCSSASSVLWECSKVSPKDQQSSVILDLLLLVGIPEDMASTFCKVFIDHKRQILALKGSLGVSAYSYQNLSWRLEVELAKRSVQVTSEPRYLVRLDLVNKAVGPAGAGESAQGAESLRHRSHHLQADHASMKLLEQELQRAVDEMSSVHCQRINRYMS